jgi:hypothetical protein
MELVKVLKVIEPKKRGYVSCYALYELTLQFPNRAKPVRVYKSRDEYKKFLLEQELLKQGAEPSTLEDYNELCYRLGQDNVLEN